ncbi:MAG: CHY zinc finger protein [Pyrinomonadaceae bacterium]
MNIFGEIVKGSNVEAQTRCAHYQKEIDIIAIKFKCCGEWFPCFQCHTENADHPAQVWSKDEFETKAILCGNCGHQLTIDEYVNCDSICPKCAAAFNPGCALHYDLYFEV